MRARNLIEPFPTVGLDTDALEAAQLMGANGLSGLIVCSEDGSPHSVLPGSEVLRFVIPRYVQDDPALARAYDEKSSDELCGKLVGRTVRDVLPAKRDLDKLPVVDHDATTIEVAAVMARTHSPMVAVIDGNRLLGAITVSRLLGHWIPEDPGRQ